MQWPHYINDYRLTAGGFGFYMQVILALSLWLQIHTHAYITNTPRSCQSCGLQSSGVSLASVFRYCSLQPENRTTAGGLTTGVRVCGMCIVFRKRGTVERFIITTLTSCFHSLPKSLKGTWTRLDLDSRKNKLWGEFLTVSNFVILDRGRGSHFSLKCSNTSSLLQSSHWQLWPTSAAASQRASSFTRVLPRKKSAYKSLTVFKVGALTSLNTCYKRALRHQSCRALSQLSMRGKSLTAKYWLYCQWNICKHLLLCFYECFMNKTFVTSVFLYSLNTRIYKKYGVSMHHSKK